MDTAKETQISINDLFSQIKNSPSGICRGLESGALSPGDLDVSNKDHRQLVAAWLIQHPTAEIPSDWISSFSDHILVWNQKIPALTKELLKRLSSGNSLTYDNGAYMTPTICSESTFVNQKVLKALLPALARKKWTGGEFAVLKSRLEKANLYEEFVSLRRKSGRERAAATRLKTKSLGVPREKTRDPLIDAVASGDASRLTRFNLQKLTKSRFNNVLPHWLSAKPPIRIHLLECPLCPKELRMGLLREFLKLGTEVFRIPFSFSEEDIFSLPPSLRLSALKRVFSITAPLEIASLPDVPQARRQLLDCALIDPERTAEILIVLEVRNLKHAFEAEMGPNTSGAAQTERRASADDRRHKEFDANGPLSQEDVRKLDCLIRVAADEVKATTHFAEHKHQALIGLFDVWHDSNGPRRRAIAGYIQQGLHLVWYAVGCL